MWLVVSIPSRGLMSQVLTSKEEQSLHKPILFYFTFAMEKCWLLSYLLIHKQLNHIHRLGYWGIVLFSQVPVATNSVCIKISLEFSEISYWPGKMPDKGFFARSGPLISVYTYSWVCRSPSFIIQLIKWHFSLSNNPKCSFQQEILYKVHILPSA